LERLAAALAFDGVKGLAVGLISGGAALSGPALTGRFWLRRCGRLRGSAPRISEGRSSPTAAHDDAGSRSASGGKWQGEGSFKGALDATDNRLDISAAPPQSPELETRSNVLRSSCQT
jgi:hypothetical protein